MTTQAESLQQALMKTLGDRVLEGRIDHGHEVTIVVAASQWRDLAQTLRDDPSLRFEQLIDLCGVDYSGWKNDVWTGRRFAVVMHLLSVTHNWRLRVRAFCDDDEAPVIGSVNDVWSAANWFEREAFDLYGIIFQGHEDLRRILTDYGFIGHPFRKDFPSHGHVEMRYDAEQRRVIYQPVTIELRENVPRIVREDHYGGMN